MDIDGNNVTGNRRDLKNNQTQEDVKVHDTSGFEARNASRCRACLLSGLKLFNIHENKLADAFSRITGTLVYKDRFPQHLCWYCRAVLLRGDAFRDKCLRSQEQLMAELQGQAADYVHTDSPLVPNLTLGAIQTVDCIDTKPDDIKDEPHSDIDIVDIDTIINSTVLKTESSGDEVPISDKVKLNDVKVNDLKKNKRSAVKKKIVIGNDTEDSDGFDAGDVKDVIMKRSTVKKKIVIGNDTEDSDGFDAGDVKDVKMKRSTVKKKIVIGNDTEDSDGYDAEDVKDVKMKRSTVKKKIVIGNDTEDSDGYDAEDVKDVKMKRSTVKKKIVIGNDTEDSDGYDAEDVKDVKMKRSTVKKKIEIRNDTDEDSDGFEAENIEIEIGEDNHTYVSSIDIASPVKKGASNDRKKKNNVKKIKKEVGADGSKDLDVNTKPKQVKRRRKNKEKMRKFRNAENDYMPVFDFSKFESSWGVKIVTLSKEEQLNEIESRKQSSNYIDSPLKCEDCGKGFVAEAAFSNHRLRHDPSAGPYVCEICKARFKMKCRQQEHQDTHLLKFVCQECGFVSRTRHQARKHQAMHAGKIYACQHCGKAFYKSSTYLSHVRLAHPAMNVACELCGETFLGQVGLRQHKAKTHGINNHQFKCTTCSVSFVSLDALNRHTDKGEHAGSPCEQCGESCASEDALRAHVGEKHPSESHRCEECNATFSSAASYDLHHRRKHLNQPYSSAGRPPRARAYPAARGQFVCEQCGRIQPTAALLRLHQRIHEAVRQFACPQCPKRFAAKHSLDWHIRSHTGERPFQCPQCPLAFSLKSNLNRHHKAVHLGQRKRVPCAICARVFTTNSCLRVHTDMVHRGVPWPKRDRKRNKTKQ